MDLEFVNAFNNDKLWEGVWTRGVMSNCALKEKDWRSHFQNFKVGFANIEPHVVYSIRTIWCELRILFDQQIFNFSLGNDNLPS